MIEAAEQSGAISPGRDAGRGDRRQHRPRPGAGRRAQGLPPHPRHPRQDEPGEDLPPARDGRRGAHDALRRRQGPSGVLPGHGRSASPRETGGYYVNQFGNPANPLRARDHHRPGDLATDGRAARRGRVRRRLGRHDHRPEPLLRARRAARRDGARRSRRLGPRRLRRDRAASARRARGWSRASARTSSRRSADLSRVRHAYTITDEESLLTARALLARRGHPRRLVVRHAGRRGAALLPRADASRSASSRFVCDSGNKYLSKMFNDYWMLDQGFLPASAARRPARPDRAQPRARRRGRRRARRHAARPRTRA